MAVSGRIIQASICAVIIIALIPCLFSEATTDKGISGALRNFLQSKIQLTDQEIRSVIAGRPLAKSLKTETREEVAVFAIVKIEVPQEFFIERIRNIVEFEGGTHVHSAGIIHSPPLLSDVAALQLDDQDLKEIPRCKPSDCEVKLSERAMQYLQREMDWSAPDAESQAHALIRKLLVNYVTAYQRTGDDALSTYYDKDKPQNIREGLRKLQKHSTEFFQYDQELANYLEKYPNEKPQNTEDIFYWQKAEFGFKPVVRISHMVIHRTANEKEIRYAIASKMLFASHYFRAALELKTIVPDGGESIYVLCWNRSFADGLSGIRGLLIGGKVKAKSRESLVHYLTVAKQKLEKSYKAQRSQSVGNATSISSLEFSGPIKP